jgi:hypothetical protein
VCGDNENKVDEPSKRGVGYCCNAKLTACFQEVDGRIFDVDSKGRVFDLYGVDVMNFTCSSQGIGGDFTEA